MDVDERGFEALVEPHRRELHAHCYRMLGSVHDAEEALQETLLAAWRGLAGFEGRSSVRTWLYRIATNVCIRASDQRGRRWRSTELGSPFVETEDLGEPRDDVRFVEPYPDDPADTYELRESVELAFVAALQQLPATQRAVLVLREVLGLSAAEVAETLDTSVAAVNSGLQRARQTVAGTGISQQSVLTKLGDDGQRALLDAFTGAWQRRDIDGLVALLAEDVRVAMPPLPAWYDGIDAARRFFAERIFREAWKLVPLTANGGQLAIAGYMADGSGAYPLGNVDVLTLDADGRIARIDAFLGPDLTEPFRRFLPPTR